MLECECECEAERVQRLERSWVWAAVTLSPMSEIFQTRLGNGLTVLAEPLGGVRSLAMTLLVPAGVASQPGERQGVAPVLAEMATRGAGGRTAREHSEALDTLGVMRSTEAQTRFFRVGAIMIGEHLDAALPLVLDMARSPNLDEAALGPSVDLQLQSLDALADEPQRRVMLNLRARHYPEPVGRSPLGVREHLQSLRLDDVRAFWQERFRPEGSIIAFAGHFDRDHLVGLVEDLLGEWEGQAAPAVASGEGAGGTEHEAAETTQVHIALAYPTVAEPDDDAALQQAAVAVLSGGMSGRLFTEVREKRGLVYAVSASYAGQKDRGDVMAYAGTTAPRAQETLDVLSAELRRLSDGVTQEEFDRAIVGMKSRLVMQGESSSARAAAIATDQYIYGRPKALGEHAAEVDAVTLDAVNGFVASHRPERMTVVTLGPEALRVQE